MKKNNLSLLFGKKLPPEEIQPNDSIICPFCLDELILNNNKCSNNDCGKEITKAYLKYAVRIKPTIIGVVGFTDHGKTVHLASLFFVLEKLSSLSIWPGFYNLALNQDTLDDINKNKHLLESGKIPDHTDTSFKDPCIQYLNHIPLFEESLLLIYDTGGENYETIIDIVQRARFIRKANCIFFLISLDKIDKDKNLTYIDVAEHLKTLLNTYINSMYDLDSETKEQSLIILFTQGDKLDLYFPDYPDIWKYTQSSELDKWEINMEQYIQKMVAISDRLRDFTQIVLRAGQFINLADDNFERVTFCLTSALGSNPENGKLSVKISPRRVLDPLLWAIYGSASRDRNPFNHPKINKFQRR